MTIEEMNLQCKTYKNKASRPKYCGTWLCKNSHLPQYGHNAFDQCKKYGGTVAEWHDATDKKKGEVILNGKRYRPKNFRKAYC